LGYKFVNDKNLKLSIYDIWCPWKSQRRFQHYRFEGRITYFM